MKITTYIDKHLLTRAMRATKAVSQREVLEAGLRNILAEVHRKTFVKEFNQFRLTWTSRRLARARA